MAAVRKAKMPARALKHDFNGQLHDAAVAVAKSKNAREGIETLYYFGLRGVVFMVRKAKMPARALKQNSSRA